MDKHQLMELYGLHQLARDTHGKKHPVECPVCDTIFEGCHRAKIFQHTSAHEHRRLWRSGKTKLSEVQAIADAQETADHTGKCQGLRLNSELGLSTRLGGDLRPIWNVYVEFASLDWTDWPKIFQHESWTFNCFFHHIALAIGVLTRSY